MDWLNYHHLFYFWMTAREGGVTAASERLRIAQPTISTQIRVLENQFGEKLFRKVGRKLELTEVGRMVYGYAEEIFSIGQELMDNVRGRGGGRPVRFIVGVADVVPKLVAYRLLQPALMLDEPVRMTCHEDKPEKLLPELATHALDLVLTDAPLSGSIHVRAFNHQLGESTVSLFAAPELAKKLRRGFPKSLDGTPMLMPTDNTVLRRALDTWLADRGIHPRIVAEFEDSALLKSFGQSGAGVFPGTSAISAEICAQHRVQQIGTIDDVTERYYAISVERRIRHPAVAAVVAAAPGLLQRPG